MNTYDFIPQFSKMLKNLDGWLVKATAHATTKKFEVDVLVNARLAPDQYPLVKQVQAACDSAKFSAAYLSGKEAPAHPDTEARFAGPLGAVMTKSTTLSPVSLPAVGRRAYARSALVEPNADSRVPSPNAEPVLMPT